PVHINQLLREIVQDNNTLIDYKKIKISWHLNASEPLMLDKDTVSKIINNLLSNAIKYTHQYIHITTEIATPQQLTITVKNDGDLIPEEEIDRKSTRLNSSHVKISYAVFCLKKKRNEHTKI